MFFFFHLIVCKFFQIFVIFYAIWFWHILASLGKGGLVLMLLPDWRTASASWGKSRDFRF